MAMVNGIGIRTVLHVLMSNSYKPISPSVSPIIFMEIMTGIHINLILFSLNRSVYIRLLPEMDPIGSLCNFLVIPGEYLIKFFLMSPFKVPVILKFDFFKKKFLETTCYVKKKGMKVNKGLGTFEFRVQLKCNSSL